MRSHLTLLALLMALLIVPGCGWCKREGKKKTKPAAIKKVKPMKTAYLDDLLYNIDDEEEREKEELMLAENEEDDADLFEEDAPRKV